ncbi:MAG: uracil-DNA glycosylase [Spirochaetota bacterium]
MGEKRRILLAPAWLALLGDCFSSPQMEALSAFLRSEKQQGKTIYPPGNRIFAAFEYFAPEQTKVIILGQDPYHGPDQACGLSFAVPKNQPFPPSLQNIYKELSEDLPGSHTARLLARREADGTLLHWAKQGVLLLNSVLTVEAGKAASHGGKGWEEFTDQVISRLSERQKNLVFLLWGSYAHKKASRIRTENHCLIRSPHPSPLSAHRGFFGSRPFSRCNDYLQKHGREPINW